MADHQFKALRKKLGLTQKQLADALGINIRTVSRYELGLMEITVTVKLAMKMLQVEADQQKHSDVSKND